MTWGLNKLQVHYFSFREKRSLGSLFYTTNCTSISPFCLDKLDTVLEFRQAKVIPMFYLQVWNLKQDWIKTLTTTVNFLLSILSQGIFQSPTKSQQFGLSKVLVKYCLLVLGVCELSPFLSRSCSPRFHQDWCLSSSHHYQALSQ